MASEWNLFSPDVLPGEELDLDQPSPSPGKVTLTCQLPPRRSVHSASARPRATTIQAKLTSHAERLIQRYPDDVDYVEALHFREAAVHPHDSPTGDTGENRIQRSPAQTTGANQTGPGAPLAEPVRHKMETAFNADFSSVRVHEGQDAPAVGAVAYARGADIHFAPGRYQPVSLAGQELIGHELAHVVQQAEGRVRAPSQAKGAPVVADPSLEAEADELGARAARGQPARTAATSLTPIAADSAIQRQTESSGKDAAGRAREIKRCLLDGWTEDEEGALKQLRGQSPAMLADIRTEYIKLTQREPERDFKAYCNEKQANEAMALFWSSMSLYDKLRANIEEGTFWNTENEEGMLDVLRNASKTELEKARGNKTLIALLEDSLSEAEMFEARKLMAIGKQRDALMLDAAIERIESAAGYLNDDENAVWDALIELTPAQRQKLWDDHQSIFDFIDEGAERESLKKICTKGQAVALSERMRLATAGLGTDDDAVRLVAEKTGQSAKREKQLEDMLARGVDEDGKPLTAKRRAELQKEHNALGGIRDKLLTPEREVLGHLTENSFLEMLRDDVGSAEFNAFATQMGVKPYEIAKQEIVEAVGSFSTDEKRVYEAFERLPKPLRTRLRNDAVVWAKLEVYLDDAERAIADVYAGGDAYEIAKEKLKDALYGVNTDETGVIGLIAKLPEQHRTRLAGDKLWTEEIQNSWAFSRREKAILQSLMTTGELPKDDTLDYALGYEVTSLDTETLTETTSIEGGAGGMEMLQVWIATLSNERRAHYRLGYWLSRSEVEPDTPALVACRKEFVELERRMAFKLGTDDIQKALDQLIGPPTAADMKTAQGRRVAADIMAARIRDKQKLQGSAADAFTESDETADMASVQFMAYYNELIADGDVSVIDLAVLGHLSKQYDTRYSEYVSTVDIVANIAGTVAAIAAGIVVMVLSGGTAAPLVGAALAKWTAAGAVAGAIAKVGVSEVMGGSHYEATGAEGGKDALAGAVDGALAVLSASLAARFTNMVGLGQKTLATTMTGNAVASTRAALAHVGRRFAGGAIEGVIDGALSGAVGELVLTLADEGTWNEGVWDAVCDMGAAVVKGGLIGAGTGGIVSGGMNAAGGLLQVRQARKLLPELAEHLPNKIDDLNLEQIEALATARKAIGKGSIEAEEKVLKKLEEFLSPDELDRVRVAFRTQKDYSALVAEFSKADKIYVGIAYKPGGNPQLEVGDLYHVAAAAALLKDKMPKVLFIVPEKVRAQTQQWVDQAQALLDRVAGGRVTIEYRGLQDGTNRQMWSGKQMGREGARGPGAATSAVDMLFRKLSSKDGGVLDALRSLRAHLLGGVSLAGKQNVDKFVAETMGESAEAASTPKVLVWIRAAGAHGADRNTTEDVLQTMLDSVRSNGMQPVLIGPEPQNLGDLGSVINLTKHWQSPAFQGQPDSFLRQMYMFDVLMREHGVVGQIGVKSGGMDAPALLGLPTVMLDVIDPTDPGTKRFALRMARWGESIPHYHVVYPHQNLKVAKPGALSVVNRDPGLVQLADHKAEIARLLGEIQNNHARHLKGLGAK